jgi:hypothetical protein
MVVNQTMNNMMIVYKPALAENGSQEKKMKGRDHELIVSVDWSDYCCNVKIAPR